MPPVFGPVSPSPTREVLRRLERAYGTAVSDPEQAHLGAVEKLLDLRPQRSA
jgi:hypothetical protein